MKSQFRAVLDGEERSVSQEDLKGVNIEEEHRKHKYPEICSAECPNRTCGFYTLENFGKPCQMRFEQHKNKSLEVIMKETIQKTMKPYLARLEAIENAPDLHVQRSFNGTLQEPLPVGYPELFKLRKAKHD